MTTIPMGQAADKNPGEAHAAPTPRVHSWHAHIYFDALSRDTAWQLRETIVATLIAQSGAQLVMGRFHERPVGPHPMWSYQLAFPGERLADVIEWLTLNRRGHDVFLHPNTGDALVDHRDHAVWIGHSHKLDLSGFTRAAEPVST